MGQKRDETACQAALNSLARDSVYRLGGVSYSLFGPTGTVVLLYLHLDTY